MNRSLRVIAERSCKDSGDKLRLISPCIMVKTELSAQLGNIDDFHQLWKFGGPKVVLKMLVRLFSIIRN